MCTFNGNIVIVSEIPYIYNLANVTLSYFPLLELKLIELVGPVTNQVLFIFNMINMIIVDGQPDN